MIEWSVTYTDRTEMRETCVELPDEIKTAKAVLVALEEGEIAKAYFRPGSIMVVQELPG